MRKLGKASIAKVIPMRRQVSLEIGVDEAKGCIFVKMSGHDPCIALTADKAEAIAADLQCFVYELRNGGKLT